MIKISFNDILTPEGKRFFDELSKVTDNDVDVGIFADSVYPDGNTVASIALQNEYGTSTIPARPFMKQTLDNRSDNIEKAIEGLLNSATGSTSADDLLSEFGGKMAEAMQEEILYGSFAPNAPSTVARKGHNLPLVDTEQMWDSVTYKVRGKSEGGQT